MSHYERWTWRVTPLPESRRILHGCLRAKGPNTLTLLHTKKLTPHQIVIPRSPVQAKGLLLSSIRDPNPVIFMEPKILYRSAVEHVPIDDYRLPLGRAEILTKGSDLTLLTWGTPIYHCEAALHLLSNPPQNLAPHVPASLRNAKIELIDLRTILPWDVETVTESVKKTGRLVVVHEASMTGGVGGEIAAEVQKRCFLKLEAPVRRVTGWE